MARYRECPAAANSRLLFHEPGVLLNCNLLEGATGRKMTCRDQTTRNVCNVEHMPATFLTRDERDLGRFTADRPDCSKARCAIVFSPRCPDDSILIEGYTPAGECCPLASRCECNPSGCLERMCRPGYERVLVSKGKGEPGECCDKYECRPMLPVASEPEDCSSVVCPEFLLKCPLDSEPVPSDQPEDSCCPLPPSLEHNTPGQIQEIRGSQSQLLDMFPASVQYLSPC
ncbi:Cysteine-rich motor neuron 1 protein [Branchiostoma belcheri]|nr:Cysteine-rich motor neuron 1 protein [Branchiostoma belcheri]